MKADGIKLPLRTHGRSDGVETRDHTRRIVDFVSENPCSEKLTLSYNNGNYTRIASSGIPETALRIAIGLYLLIEALLHFKGRNTQCFFPCSLKCLCGRTKIKNKLQQKEKYLRATIRSNSGIIQSVRFTWPH
jgi:hypothetical protein